MSRKEGYGGGWGICGVDDGLRRIVDMELADVVLTDIFGWAAGRGKLWTMVESGADYADGFVCYGGFRRQTEITAPLAGKRCGGDPRRDFRGSPGMSRDDLLKANYDVVKAVVEQIVKHSPKCILVVVTNPLDAIWAQAAFRVSGFPKNRVPGNGRACWIRRG